MTRLISRERNGENRATKQNIIFCNLTTHNKYIYTYKARRKNLETHRSSRELYLLVIYKTQFDFVVFCIK